MIINRLEMVVTSGKFDRAAALLDAAEFSARNDGNPYAQQLVRRLRFCTLSSLGKKDAAAKLLPDVLAHADDALEPTVEGLLCAGEIDKAEQLWLKALNDKDESKRQSFEEDFVHELQPAQLTDDEPYFWWNSWKSLRQRPAIAAAYERLGRDLPTDLLPEAKSVPAN